MLPAQLEHPPLARRSLIGIKEMRVSVLARLEIDPGLFCGYLERDKAGCCRVCQVALNGREPRFFAELDAILEAQGADPRRRLAILRRNHRVVRKRDDALTRQIALHVRLGQCDGALRLLKGHHFHSWEGAERRVHDLCVEARLPKGRAFFRAGRFEEALAEYVRAAEYPENFEFGRPYDRAREAEVYYFIGTAHEALGRTDEALRAWTQSLERDKKGTPPAYYQGLSCRKLGQDRRANAIFDDLIRVGREMLRSGFKPDFFAIFGNPKQGLTPPDQGHYLMALGLAGKGRTRDAAAALRSALKLNPAHLGALIAQSGVDRLWLFGKAVEATRDAAAAAGVAEKNILLTDDYAALEKAALKAIKPGDVVLVKGSRGMRLERIPAAMKAKK